MLQHTDFAQNCVHRIFFIYYNGYGKAFLFCKTWTQSQIFPDPNKVNVNPILDCDYEEVWSVKNMYMHIIHLQYYV